MRSVSVGKTRARGTERRERVALEVFEVSRARVSPTDTGRDTKSISYLHTVEYAFSPWKVIMFLIYLFCNFYNLSVKTDCSRISRRVSRRLIWLQTVYKGY